MPRHSPRISLVCGSRDEKRKKVAVPQGSPSPLRSIIKAGRDNRWCSAVERVVLRDMSGGSRASPRLCLTFRGPAIVNFVHSVGAPGTLVQTIVRLAAASSRSGTGRSTSGWSGTGRSTSSGSTSGWGSAGRGNWSSAGRGAAVAAIAAAALAAADLWQADLWAAELRAMELGHVEAGLPAAGGRTAAAWSGWSTAGRGSSGSASNRSGAAWSTSGWSRTGRSGSRTRRGAAAARAAATMTMEQAGVGAVDAGETNQRGGNPCELHLTSPNTIGAVERERLSGTHPNTLSGGLDQSFDARLHH